MQKDNEVNRELKQKLLQQQAKVIWFTGLPCSGKTTLARNFEKILINHKFTCIVLDGDVIRNGLNKDLGFSVNSRLENIRRIAEFARILINNGIIVIVSLVSPLNELRKIAKEIIGEDDYLEIFLNAPLSTCEERDVKGMYKKARQGIIKDFTGIDAIYENPKNPFLEILTSESSIEDSLKILTDKLLPQIKFEEV